MSTAKAPAAPSGRICEKDVCVALKENLKFCMNYNPICNSVLLTSLH